MFGSYQFGKPVILGSTTLETYQDEGVYVYHRKSDSELKKIMSSPLNLQVNPVEPVTQPEKVTHYLLINLACPVLVAPKSTITLFLTFPIEIGVFPEPEESTNQGFFINTKREEEPIDLFTLTRPKYTLYGEPDNGVICKMWQSGIHTHIPQVSPLYEGVANLEIENSASQQKEIRNLVFDVHYMRIFYREVAMVNAVVKIRSNGTAETSFLGEPPLEGMKEGARIFNHGGVLVMERESFLMEWGL
ncbi:MAG: DUF432 domain-containing protein [Theionarchaea archaeon]|nr:DUF432 domain-containing protein [Theionarchaea archaeon]MBU7000062.1 DUF432 domain-containing protein [Theionarchaea archaeon]MBU7021640.1 DUF432 domain-containing protein [Theionarchaea archaeon]MBU7034897.1 DUF432 domain-containing protein [Theionarchaea archaeon]MBU7039373.1 DUF432 domain-containing protein [Theionarchaea archaeon]